MYIKDQIGNKLNFDRIPERMVSLVPSQTELLIDLGLEDKLVGVTKFCVHPQYLRKEKQIVGGTKEVSYSKIADLNPDIIFCNKEENTKEMVAQLQKIAPVHVSNIVTIHDALELIDQYGVLFKKESQAAYIINRIHEERKSFRESFKPSASVKNSVGYLIWKDPMMVAGADTFINVLLSEVGLENAFASKEGRYPEVQWGELNELDYIFLSSEPFPFKEKHLASFKEHTHAKVMLVDGEYFSWYGSRLIEAFSYFRELRSRLKF